MLKQLLRLNHSVANGYPYIIATNFNDANLYYVDTNYNSNERIALYLFCLILRNKLIRQGTKKQTAIKVVGLLLN